MGRREKVTRAEVLAAARETFVERGFEGTTLADIAGRLGVSPAALLRHAPTKQRLFSEAMRAAPAPEMLPLIFLADVPGTADPAQVLRRVAHVLVPFIEGKLTENLGRWVHFKRLAGRGRLPLPFDPAARPTPPERNLRLLEDYFRRAQRAGRLRVRNVRAAAFAYLASLQSFVMLQEVIQVLEDRMSLDVYLDTLISIWRRGALRSARKGR